MFFVFSLAKTRCHPVVTKPLTAGFLCRKKNQAFRTKKMILGKIALDELIDIVIFVTSVS